MRFLRIPEGTVSKTLPEVPRFINDLAFSPDEKTVAVVSSSRKSPALHLLPSDGRSGGKTVWLDFVAESIEFAPHSNLLSVLPNRDSRSKYLFLHDLAQNRWRFYVDRHHDAVTYLRFTPDGQRVVTSGRDGTVRIWNSSTGEVVDAMFSAELPARRDAPVVTRPCALSSDGGFLATADGDRILIRTLPDLEEREIPNAGSSVTCVALAPEGETIAWLSRTTQPDQSGQHRETLHVRRVGAGGDWFRVPKLLSGPRSLAFSPDGRILAVRENLFTKNRIVLYDASLGRQLREIPVTAKSLRPWPTSFCYSSDGQRLAIVSGSRTVDILSIEGGAPLRRIRFPSRVNDVAFSPDRKLLACAGEPSDRGIVLWIHEVSTGRLVHETAGHEEPVLAVAFSPDGETLATGSVDATALVWERPASRIASAPPQKAARPSPTPAETAGVPRKDWERGPLLLDPHRERKLRATREAQIARRPPPLVAQHEFRHPKIGGRSLSTNPERLWEYLTSPNTPFLHRMGAAYRSRDRFPYRWVPRVMRAIRDLRQEEQAHNWGLRFNPAGQRVLEVNVSTVKTSKSFSRLASDEQGRRRTILGRPWELPIEPSGFVPVHWEETAKAPWPLQVKEVLTRWLSWSKPRIGGIPNSPLKKSFRPKAGASARYRRR